MGVKLEILSAILFTYIFCKFTRKLQTKRMKNTTVFFALLLTLFSCQTNDEKLCQCVEKGALVDKYSVSLIGKQNVTKEEEAKLDQLRDEMHASCEAFKFMPSEELQAKKQACSSLQFEAK